MKKFKIKDSNGKAYLIEAKTYKEALKRFKDAVDKRSFVLKRKPNSQGEYVVEAYRNGYRDTPYDYATLDYDDAYASLLSLARTFRLTVTRSASMFIADSLSNPIVFKYDDPEIAGTYYEVIDIDNSGKEPMYTVRTYEYRKGKLYKKTDAHKIPQTEFLHLTKGAKRVSNVGDESPVKGLEPGMIFKVEEGYHNIYYKIIKITDKDVYFQKYLNKDGSDEYRGSMDSEPISYFLKILKRAKRVNSIYDSLTNDEKLIKDVALQKGDWFTFRHEADNFSFRLYKVIDDRQLSTNGFTEAMMCEKYIGSYDFRKKKFIMTKEGRETVKYDDYLKNNAVKFNSSDEALNWIKRQVEIRNTNKYFDSVDTANIDFDYLLAEERKAVKDYKEAIKMTDDKSALYVLSHILKEESHHIELLEQLRDGKVEFADSITNDETITVSKRKRNTASDNDAVDAAVDVLSEYGLYPDEGVDREDSYRGSLDFSSKSNRDRAVNILKKSNQFRIVDPYGDEEGLFSIHIKM